MLRKEIARLRAEIVDVREALFAESENTTKHIKKLYRSTAELRDYLMPIVHKVFPDFTETKKQIDALVRRYAQQRHRRKRA